MAKKIHPKRLGFYLWNDGPYIYFFNGKCFGVNREIVNYLNFKANSFKMIKVLQIEWSHYLSFNPLSLPELMNNVYVYFEGEQKFELKAPGKEEIDSIFTECIEYYNTKIDKLVKNIGSKKKLEKSEESLISTKTDKSKISDFLNFQYRKRTLLRKKVCLKGAEPLPPIIQPVLHKQQKPKYKRATKKSKKTEQLNMLSPSRELKNHHQRNSVKNTQSKPIPHPIMPQNSLNNIQINNPPYLTQIKKFIYNLQVGSKPGCINSPENSKILKFRTIKPKEDFLFSPKLKNTSTHKLKEIPKNYVQLKRIPIHTFLKSHSDFQTNPAQNYTQIKNNIEFLPIYNHQNSFQTQNFNHHHTDQNVQDFPNIPHQNINQLNSYKQVQNNLDHIPTQNYQDSFGCTMFDEVRKQNLQFDNFGNPPISLTLPIQQNQFFENESDCYNYHREFPQESIMLNETEMMRIGSGKYYDNIGLSNLTPNMERTNDNQINMSSRLSNNQYLNL